MVYDYTPDRSRAGPSKWLDEFRGFLQADAYGGYDGIYATGVKEVACWAHYPECIFIPSCSQESHVGR